MRDKNVQFYIGNKDVKLKENNIIVGENEYAGTPGLWELIVAITFDDKIFTNDNYARNNAFNKCLKENNDESETKPKANKTGNRSTY